MDGVTVAMSVPGSDPGWQRARRGGSVWSGCPFPAMFAMPAAGRAAGGML
ncbi:MAG: hypothetical protein ACRDZR_02565 [Acidimicrobiales bacterium]